MESIFHKTLGAFQKLKHPLKCPLQQVSIGCHMKNEKKKLLVFF
jgi:hypothetical protein